MFLKWTSYKNYYSSCNTHKIWSNNTNLSFSKRKIGLCVIVKSNLHSPISNLNFHFYETFSASKLCMCKRCSDMLLIDLFYTIERITAICKRIFSCLAHISHLPILIQLKEVRTVWPMNEPYFNWGHFYVNWNIPTTNSQPVTSYLQLLFWKVTVWSPKRQRIENAGKRFITAQNYSLLAKAKDFKCSFYANILYLFPATSVAAGWNFNATSLSTLCITCLFLGRKYNYSISHRLYILLVLISATKISLLCISEGC